MNIETYIRECEKNNQIYKFYKLKVWKKLRSEILRKSHNECYDCKQRGVLTLGSKDEPLEVHHINFIRVRPDLALSEYFIDVDGIEKPNLVALCHKCHDKRHDRFGYSSKKYTNIERW